MRVILNGNTLGFTRTSDDTAEIAYYAAAGTPTVGQQIRIDGDVWKVGTITQSEYVRLVMVAKLWRIS